MNSLTNHRKKLKGKLILMLSRRLAKVLLAANEFRNSAKITASHIFQRIFGGNDNFGGSGYSAVAGKFTQVIATGSLDPKTGSAANH